MNRKIAVVMGSDSDFKIMERMIQIFQENKADYEYRVISAHRTPFIAADFAKNAKADGFDIIIAGAGMSAHLGGVLAACTGLPVIGLPIKSASSGMDGMDALHSIIQMPPGIPVAAVGIDNAEGAAKLAVKMLDCPGEKTVRVQYNESDAENLEKVKKALALYGIAVGENGAFAVINLTDTPVESNLPVINVPQKAADNVYGATSRKIYDLTNASESGGFVGVGAYQNAVHMAERILGIHDAAVYQTVVDEHAKLATAVIEKDAKIRADVNAGK